LKFPSKEWGAGEHGGKETGAGVIDDGGGKEIIGGCRAEIMWRIF